ncbi:MAG: 4-hydroxy-tetrahydrodipicolinate synthase [Clostridia bacterium]|nr:4-hydroxy-tetrahydrodipicolinate synthase [Clostridia bacterium]
MKKTLFRGAATAVITPFKNDSVDFEALDRLIEFQIKGGISALVICGTTGESATLTDKEHIAVIDRAVKTTAGRVPVIAGTGSNCTSHAVMMSKEAAACGADALLLVTPYYNKTTQPGLIRHFNVIADSTDLPCIVYNVPSRTGVNVLPETYAALSRHPNITAAKEANGDLEALKKTVALCGDALDIYSGNDDQIVPILELGGKGVISVLSNPLPGETDRIVRSFMEGKIDEAKALQAKYLPFIRALFCEVNPIPVKAVMAMLGFCADEIRLPLVHPEEEHLALIREEMKKIGLL